MSPGDAATSRGATQEGESPMPDEGYFHIPLRSRDGVLKGVALVDETDATEIGKHRWHLLAGGYAARTGPRPDRRMIYMHREVAGLEHGDRRQVDHINGKRLDNRSLNLRAVAPGENAINRHGSKGTSRFRGVFWNKQRSKWRAQIGHEGKNHVLGDFDCEADAGRAVLRFLVDHDPTAAANASQYFADALTEDEWAEQSDRARERLIAAFSLDPDATGHISTRREAASGSA